MASPRSLINRAYRLAAGVGGDPHTQPTIDNLWAFEEAFPLALHKSVAEIGYSPSEIEHYRRRFALTFAAGVVALSDDILHDQMDRSVLVSESDSSITENVSWCPRFSEFINPPHTALPYYTTAEKQIHFREGSAARGVFAGDLVLYAIATPAIPALITDTITLPDDIADRTVEIMAEMIRGAAVSA